MLWQMAASLPLRGCQAASSSRGAAPLGRLPGSQNMRWKPQRPRLEARWVACSSSQCATLAAATTSLAVRGSSLRRKAWSDMLLIAGSLAICGAAEPFTGSEVSGWAAVTVCVVTGLQTDLRGREVRIKGLQRLVGTLAGVLLAGAVGRSWLCMASWAAVLALAKRRFPPAYSYIF
ncbi:unnamed protein product, partial [Polarella glacialis]